MSAYYYACLKYPEDKQWTIYEIRDFDYYAKLLNHSYIGHSYTRFITKKIYCKPAYLIWAHNCYEDEQLNSDTTIITNLQMKNIRKEAENMPLLVIYVNLTRSEYFSIKKILELAGESLIKARPPLYAGLCQIETNPFFSYPGQPREYKYYTYVIHPLPLLTNSEKEYTGDGDYLPDYKPRGHWAKDLITALPITAEPIVKKHGFKDVTKKVLVEIDDYADTLYVKGQTTFMMHVLNYMKKVKALHEPKNAIITEYSSYIKNIEPSEEISEDEIVRILSLK